MPDPLIEPLRMTAKARYTDAMMQYWSDPDNTFITRTDMFRSILRITATTFYRHFTPEEISTIENEASIARRKRYARQRSEIVEAMYTEGKTGNVSAAKEFLDRTEGKVAEKYEHSGGVTVIYPPLINKPEDSGR